MKIICIIPALKEKGNLEKLTGMLSEELVKLKIPFKILFIIQTDDGSIELLEKIRKRIKHIDYLFYKKALGIGKAYQCGFRNISSEYSHLLTLDADLNHNPSDIRKFIRLYKEKHPDIIIGSRYIKGGRFNDKRGWKRFISQSVNAILINMLKINVHDISSGFRLINCKVIKNVSPKLNQTGYPSYMELILRAKKAGFSIDEVPITYSPRTWGKSKMGKWQTMIDYLLFLPQLISFF